MKTTIDISDGLYQRCKKLIQKEHTSMRSLVEEGLEIVVERHEHPIPFEFSPATFGGAGMRQEFVSGGWNAIEEEIYKDRGGNGSR
jgi:hypothetical protein